MKIVEHNAVLRKISGEYKSNDPLTSFLYQLMRDYLAPGIIEGIVRDSESKEETLYTNGWLATYAEYLSKRLK